MRRLFLAIAFCLVLPLAAFARDASWAVPQALPGVSNLNQVSATLFRSAQPTAEGFKALESKLKVQTDVDLRLNHSDAPLLAGTQIISASAPMSTFMSQADLTKALKLIVAAEKHGAVVVHCERGADRTGAVIALYRVVVQGWTKEKAITEMEHGGFHFDFLQFNIPYLIRHADVAAIRAALAKGP